MPRAAHFAAVVQHVVVLTASIMFNSIVNLMTISKNSCPLQVARITFKEAAELSPLTCTNAVLKNIYVVRCVGAKAAKKTTYHFCSTDLISCIFEHHTTYFERVYFLNAERALPSLSSPSNFDCL